MYKIYEKAMEISSEAKSVIVRLDIQFNYETQTYIGFLILANNKEYSIRLTETVISVNP